MAFRNQKKRGSHFNTTVLGAWRVKLGLTPDRPTSSIRVLGLEYVSSRRDTIQMTQFSSTITAIAYWDAITISQANTLIYSPIPRSARKRPGNVGVRRGFPSRKSNAVPARVQRVAHSVGGPCPARVTSAMDRSADLLAGSGFVAFAPYAEDPQQIAWSARARA
jgi:hypothetical protein